MNERVWVCDRLFNGFDRFELDGGDRRVFEDVAVAPMHQRFDPLIGGTGMEDHQIVVGGSVNLDDQVDERDSSYVDPDESDEQELVGLAPSKSGVNPLRVIESLCSLSMIQ